MASDVYTAELRANWARSINPNMMVSSCRMSELRMFCSDRASLMSTDSKALAPRRFCGARWSRTGSLRPADRGGPWLKALECFNLHNITSAMLRRVRTHFGCVLTSRTLTLGADSRWRARGITRIARHVYSQSTMHCRIPSHTRGLSGNNKARHVTGSHIPNAYSFALPSLSPKDYRQAEPVAAVTLLQPREGQRALFQALYNLNDGSKVGPFIFISGRFLARGCAFSHRRGTPLTPTWHPPST